MLLEFKPTLAQECFFRDAAVSIDLIRAEAEMIRSPQVAYLPASRDCSASDIKSAKVCIDSLLDSAAKTIERLLTKLFHRLIILQTSGAASSEINNAVESGMFQIDLNLLDIPDELQTEKMTYCYKSIRNAEIVYEEMTKAEVISKFRSFFRFETQQTLENLKTWRSQLIQQMEEKDRGEKNIAATTRLRDGSQAIILSPEAFILARILNAIETIEKVQTILTSPLNEDLKSQADILFKEVVLKRVNHDENRSQSSIGPSKNRELTKEQKEERERSFLPPSLNNRVNQRKKSIQTAKKKKKKGVGNRSVRELKSAKEDISDIPSSVSAEGEILPQSVEPPFQPLAATSNSTSESAIDDLAGEILKNLDQNLLLDDRSSALSTDTLVEFSKENEEEVIGRIYKGESAKTREISILRKSFHGTKSLAQGASPSSGSKFVEEQTSPKEVKDEKYYFLGKKDYFTYEVLFKMKNSPINDQDLIRLICALLKQSNGKGDYLRQKSGQITVRLNGHIFRFDPTHGRDAHRVYEDKAAGVRKHLEQAGVIPSRVFL